MAVRSPKGVVVGTVAGVDTHYFTLRTTEGGVFLVPLSDVEVVNGEVKVQGPDHSDMPPNEPFLLAEPHWIEAVLWIIAGIAIGGFAGLYLG